MHINALMVGYNKRPLHIRSLRGLDCDVHVLTRPRDFRTPSWVMIAIAVPDVCDPPEVMGHQQMNFEEVLPYT